MNIFVIGKSRRTWLVLLYFVFSSCVRAEEIPSYDEIASGSFWQNLYPGGGWSLYCGYKFGLRQKTGSNLTIGIEHIYPTTAMARHAACHNRMQCRESKNLEFMRMEADLHNLYPVWQTVITHRYDFRFGLVNGEDWRFDDCDLEWKSGIIEPRQIARGNIARAMLYMHSRYDIPVDSASLALFKVWNRIDPPSKQEKVRNNRIERLQGNRNPYIDKPSLAEQQKLTMLK
jgi:deoxyribonuclease I